MKEWADLYVTPAGKNKTKQNGRGRFRVSSTKHFLIHVSVLCEKGFLKKS